MGQKTLSGILAPCIAADQAELVGIAQGMRKAGRGILQIAPEFNQYPRAEEELKMIIAVARETGCKRRPTRMAGANSWTRPGLRTKRD